MKLPLFATGMLAMASAVAEMPDGYWSAEDTQAILDSTLRVSLDPDLSHLSEAETRAVQELVAAGRVMHALYETQLHKDALAARAALEALHASGADTHATRNLLDLFYVFKGPVGTTLDNQRLAFVPASGEQAGKKEGSSAKPLVLTFKRCE